MSVSLFRRWRSQKFSDLVGQQSVVSTLQNVLRAGDPARAYLFCGPRGTGKTSSARIFAKALNCENGPTAEPCNECSQCRSIAEGSNLDVFEIDAASHTQVDKIRDFIVEKVHFTPVSARFKVYIIDEVHKLSTSSFNALLKTLEEPPSHVVFVLATTHPHEMPSTILSRCQRYDFRPLTASEAESHLKMIAGVENIKLDDDAARQLARAADGSLRDALVLFEQADVFSESNITRDSVLDLLGNVGYEVLEEMFTDLHQGDAAAALTRLDQWIVRGRDLKRLAESFQDHLRMLLLIKVRSEDQSIRHLSTEERASLDRLAQRLSVGAITQWLRTVGEMLGQIRHGRRARLEWEMFLVSLSHPESDPSLEGVERRLERLEAGGSGGTAPVASAPVPAEFDDSRLVELERQMAALAHSQTSDERVEILEKKLEKLSAQLSSFGKDSTRPEPRETVIAPAPKPKEAEPKPSASPVVETPKIEISQENLDRDPVDEWLAMPEILVTGRIARSGQTSLLDSVEPMGGDAPSPDPLPEPEVVDDLPPEPPELEQEYDPRDEGPLSEEPPEPVKVEEPIESIPEPVAVEPESETVPEPIAETEPEPAPTPELEQAPEPAPAAQVELPDSKEFFRLLMQGVKEKDIRLHAVLADARLTALTGATFELAVPSGYEWHFGKIQEGKQLLESVAARITKIDLKMECSLGGEKASAPKENEHEELVKRASGVFGGSSVVD